MRKFSGPLARRYGTALYESALQISQTSDGMVLFEKTTEQARFISEIFDKNMVSAFNMPHATHTEKIALLENIIEIAFSKTKQEIIPQLMSFLKLLVENKRISEVNTILNFFLKKADEFLGVTRVTIVSALGTKQSDMQDFESHIANATKKKIICNYEQDPTLLSGFVIKVGDATIDASLKSRLSHLKESLA